MAKKSLISTTADGNVLAITVEGVGTISVDVSALSEPLRNRALIHGLVQKISDGAAIPKADLPSDPLAAAKVKFAGMEAIAERLIEGEWSKRSSDGSGPVAGIIYRAFEEWAMAKATAAKKSITSEQIRAIYDAKDKSGQLALRNVPEIATIIERIKSERGAGAAKVDATELLDELGIG